MRRGWIACVIIAAGLAAASTAEAGAAKGKSKVDKALDLCKAKSTTDLTPACRILIDRDAALTSAAAQVEKEAATAPPPRPAATKLMPHLAAAPAGTAFPAGHQDCDSLTNSSDPLTRLFVRADPLDNFHYLIVPPSSASTSDQKGGSAAGAKGASISYTNDQNGGTQTATINGRASYLAFGEYCGPPYFENVPFIHGFGIAPFVDGNGTWNEPVKKTSTSSLQTGVDFVAGLEFPGQTSSEQYFYLSPYHQTDFRDVADINGAILAWEPQVLAWRLGVATKATNPYIDFFWQFRGQAQWSDVSKIGYTNLTTGSHELVGDILRVNIALLPGSTTEIFGPWLSQWVVGRFSVIGTMKDFHDFTGSKNYDYYSASLSYKLGECVVPPSSDTGSGAPVKPAVAAASPQCAVSGSSSLSFEYDWGTDINTLVPTNQYVLKLTYAY